MTPEDVSRKVYHASAWTIAEAQEYLIPDALYETVRVARALWIEDDLGLELPARDRPLHGLHYPEP